MKHKIETREEYDYCLSRGFEPLVDDRFTMAHSLRVEIQKERFGGNNAQGNDKFYKFCLYHLPLVCRECGRPIRNPSAYNVSHILTRGSHPDMAHDPRNVYILCPDHHNQYEHRTTRVRMRINDLAEERISLLKKEYYADNQNPEG